MSGGDGNDTYFVQESLDSVSETNSGVAGGIDTVYSAINMALGSNPEYLFIYGSATVAIGNGLGNAVVGSYSGLELLLRGMGGTDTITGGGGNDLIDGGGGVDSLTGSGGADTFVFRPGETNGDVIHDFNGAGAGALDTLRFENYGAGATFTQIDATHWQINWFNNMLHDVITFSNAAAIHPTDYVFV
jgi:Ca2+-binding RTX toxin-like protein